MSYGRGPYYEILQASNFLAENDVLAFAWLDERMVTRWRYGKLASWIPLDENICQATQLFFGFEKDLLDLQDEHRAVLAIPRVGLMDEIDEDTKISLEIFWDDEAERYLVVVYNLNSEPEIEFELVKQIRARRLAEENYNKAKQQIAEKKVLLDLLIEHVPAAIAMFDTEMRYRFATRTWLHEFGLEFQQVNGRSHYDVFPHLSREERERHTSCLRGVEMIISDVEEFQYQDGRTHSVRWAHQPWRRADGAIGGVITFADILTPLVRSEREIKEKNQELANINRSLQEFTAIIAHDLSAPTRSIAYATQRIRRHLDNDEPLELSGEIAKIARQAERMKVMLEDLLEYSRIGRRSEAVRQVDLRALVREIVSAIAEASSFEIRFAGNWQGIRTAVAPMDLVLRNLIENAIKHHDRPTGIVTLAMTDGDDNWLFEVSDDGPGIDPSYHKLIFEPFQRLSNNDSSKSSGIGLALVKKAVETHGGSIAVASMPQRQRGTTFRIMWPKMA